MKRRLLIVGIACIALGASAASSAARRYVLVDDGWGAECYGSYEHGASLVAPLAGGPPVLRGLQTDLAHAVQFTGDGGSMVWADTSGLRLADLRTGRTVLLGRSVRRSHGTYWIGPGARTALLGDPVGSGPHLVLVTRRGRRVVRHAIARADGIHAELSDDGRYLTYTGVGGVAVRAVAGGPARWFGTLATWWAVAGDRLAYLERAHLHVLDARTGAQLLDLPVPAIPDGPIPQASWSPDGRYILLGGGAIADVRGGRISPLPAFATEAVDWRPGRGHQLLRMAFDAADLLDVATGAELWRRDGIANLRWSPDGRWLLNQDGAPYLLSHGGAPVATPPSVASPLDWLGANLLAMSGARTLRVAAAPSWRPRVITRVSPGHHLFARSLFSASPAGLRVLARTLRARAHARDCR